MIDPFNSMVAEKNLHHLYKQKMISADIQKSDFLLMLKIDLSELLDEGVLYFRGLPFLKN